MDINTILDEVRSIKTSLEERAEQLEVEKRALEQEKAAFDNPTLRHEEKKMELRDIIDAMKEKRAITIGATGSVNFVPEIVKDAQAKRPLLSMVRTFYGRDASTNIPVFSPTIARPAAQAEGATSIASDIQATLGAISVAPHAYVSVLPVTHEALLLSAANLEAELPAIFADAFAEAMYNGIVNGTGSSLDMTGLFAAGSVASANKISCAAAGLPTMADLVGLALKLQDYSDSAVLVMNPAVYSAITASADANNVVYKEELIRNKSIEGVKVILTGAAPSATTSGAALVVGMDMKNYALAVAQELTIEPLKKVGDTNTYFQASMFFNGKVIHNKNAWSLNAASTSSSAS